MTTLSASIIVGLLVGWERAMRSHWYVALVAALLLAGCPSRNPVECAVDTNCDLGGGGVCTVATTGNQWCAYPDEACPAGYRYSDAAGDDLGGECIEGTRHTLTVQVGGNGSGNVSTDRAGFSCAKGACIGKFPEGTLVNLSAVATAGDFLGWSEACRGRDACAVTMDRDLNVGALFGEPGESLWVTHIGSLQGAYGQSITVDQDDNIVAVGSFSEAITTIPGLVLTSAGGQDTFITKLSSASGQVIWAKRLGGMLADFGYGVVTDEANNVYVLGAFQGTVDFGGGPIQAPPGTGHATAASVFVLALNPNGDFRWVQKIDGTGSFFDVGTKSIAARENSVTVVGGYGDSLTIGAQTYTSSGALDIFVAGLSATDGQVAWLKSFGGTGPDTARSVAIDSSGNVVLTGNFQGTVNFGSGPLSTGASANGFLLKLAGTNGAHLAVKQFGGTNRTTGEAIAIDAANNIFITGFFSGSGTADFGCANAVTASQAGESDVFIARYTQAGSCRWVKGFGGTGTVREGKGIAVNSNGDIAAVGSFCGTISFGGPPLASASACDRPDVFAIRLTGDGEHLNSVRTGGTGFEAATGVAQSSDGRYFTCGGFQGLAEFGGQAITSLGSNDAFVVGLAPL